MKHSTLSGFVPKHSHFEKDRSWSTKKFFVDSICFLLILLFVYAAMSKVLDYQKFIVQLSKSPLLTKFSNTIAWAIPGIEIAISIAIAMPKFRLTGLYAGFCLMLLFTFYILAITQFNEGDIPCSCGGVLQNMNWNQHLLFNSIFSAMALLGILLHQPPGVSKTGSI